MFLNKLKTGWANYVAFVKENAEISKAYQEKALLEHRLKRGMASQLSRRLDVNTNMRNNDYARQQDSLRRDEFRRSYNDEYQRQLNKLRKTK